MAFAITIILFLLLYPVFKATSFTELPLMYCLPINLLVGSVPLNWNTQKLFISFSEARVTGVSSMLTSKPLHTCVERTVLPPAFVPEDNGDCIGCMFKFSFTGTSLPVWPPSKESGSAYFSSVQAPNRMSRLSVYMICFMFAVFLFRFILRV